MSSVSALPCEGVRRGPYVVLDLWYDEAVSRCREGAGCRREDDAGMEKGRGCTHKPPVKEIVEEGEFDREFFVRMFKHDFDEPPENRLRPPATLALVLTSCWWGKSDTEHARSLLEDLLLLLAENPSCHPDSIVLLDEGVRLAVSASRSLVHLQSLESMGVSVLVSRSSLYRLGLEKELRVGEPVAMLKIIEALMRSDKILNI